MSFRRLTFRPPLSSIRHFNISDMVALVLVGLFIYLGVRLAFNTPAVVQGPDISLMPSALPYYALLSLGRMLAAYMLSMTFSIIYGYTAARRPGAEKWLLPVLDILQSVPILSFLPVVLLGFIAILPQRMAVEVAAVILIFTSQAWNLTFSFYQSMTTIPTELREAAAVFRFSPWLRFRQLELPFATLPLIWNSVMSWAGGWFFLMAAEIFTLGDRDFRLPGLGAYLQTAASKGDSQALMLGIVTLVLIIVLLDQLVWRPLLSWAERFKVSQVANDNPASSWFLDGLRRSHLASAFTNRVVNPLINRLNARFSRPQAYVPSLEPADQPSQRSWLRWLMILIFVLAAVYAAVSAAGLLLTLPTDMWGQILIGAGATLLRVVLAIGIALLWTIPVGVWIGTSARAARVLQPIVQILAAIPATALFPVLLLGLLSVRGGDNIAAVLLMLLGTQWYLLFNIIAGASAIPQDLKYTSDLLQLKGWQRWRTLILPGLFPYIITGLITASGGAWNASIVAEYTNFAGKTNKVIGLGSLITSATATANYPLLLASTLVMIIVVVLINRFFWRRLFHIAETRYRMDQ
ncbi:MAG: ABC transporter permease subunit [Anaerolineaceae bacterium]|nr:ABC transporter permease subunit [Anaerolineaceae bacterium]